MDYAQEKKLAFSKLFVIYMICIYMFSSCIVLPIIGFVAFNDAKIEPNQTLAIALGVIGLLTIFSGFSTDKFFKKESLKNNFEENLKIICKNLITPTILSFVLFEAGMVFGFVAHMLTGDKYVFIALTIFCAISMIVKVPKLGAVIDQAKNITN